MRLSAFLDGNWNVFKYNLSVIMCVNSPDGSCDRTGWMFMTGGRNLLSTCKYLSGLVAEISDQVDFYFKGVGSNPIEINLFLLQFTHLAITGL